MHVHALAGCAPAPLAHYLKGLGVLRAVSQADERARGFWRDESFHLATTLDREAIVAFFAEKYEPPLITAPWNNGARFFAKDDKGLTPIERSTAPRFAPLREAIAEARRVMHETAEADASTRATKGKTKKKGPTEAAGEKLLADPAYKRRLLTRCRLEWRGAQAKWMSAAVVLAEDDKQKPAPKYPSLFGTGGNDGNFDFTNNYYQRLAGLFDLETGAPAPGTVNRIRAALFGLPGRVLVAGIPIGQFLPGTAGGANNGNGPRANSFVNPVDFVLALEGALFFTANVARRLDAQHSVAQAAAPFSSRSAASGYGSAGASDEGPRGEQWMPLWERPSSLAEVERLFAEGRARIGARAVVEPIDFAAAVARLGTARGIKSFQRYGYVQRYGNMQFAVPLGRFSVPDGGDPTLSLVDDLDAWLGRLRRAARSDHAPARLQHAERRLSDALFAAIQHPEAARWARVLLALADVDVLQASGTGIQAGPVPPLSARWVEAVDDGKPELRLALAFALQGGTVTTPRGQRVWGDGIRRHAIPLDKSGRSFAVSGDGEGKLERRPEVVVHGQSAERDAIALVDRRLIEGARRGDRHLPLVPMRGFAAYLPDVAALAVGDVDIDRALKLGRALLALKVKDRAALRKHAAPVLLPKEQLRGIVPPDAWTVLRLSTLPWAIDETCDVGVDPAVFRRLSSGDAQGAFQIARRRLAAAGVRVTVSGLYLEPEQAKRWAAAFAFPLSRRTARHLLERIDARTIDQGPNQDPKGLTT